MKARKSWNEKLADNKGLPRVAKIEGSLSTRWGTGTFVIPAPREVDDIMRRVPHGKLVTMRELRAALAERHGASIACPITTGIFAWIAAHAAEESASAGARRITPYWRTLKTDGELNAKYPGGLEAVRAKLEAEGHRVIARGRRLFVENYERALAKLPSGVAVSPP